MFKICQIVIFWKSSSTKVWAGLYYLTRVIGFEVSVQRSSEKRSTEKSSDFEHFFLLWGKVLYGKEQTKTNYVSRLGNKKWDYSI